MSSIWRACCSQGEGAPLPGGPVAERNRCQGCGQGLWAGGWGCLGLPGACLEAEHNYNHLNYWAFLPCPPFPPFIFSSCSLHPLLLLSIFCFFRQPETAATSSNLIGHLWYTCSRVRRRLHSWLCGVIDGLLNRPIRYRPMTPGPEPLHEDKNMKLTDAK